MLVYPNPIDREKAAGGTLKFSLPTAAHIKVYNIEGFIVYDKKDAYGKTEWNCRNRQGEKVSPGVYYYIIKLADEEVKGKIFITK